MKKNGNISVCRVHGAYCVRVSGDLAGAPLYWALAPYGAEAHSLGSLHGNERWVPSPAPDRRVYFAAGAADGTLQWAGDTAVEIASVENFRDMGGYLTAGGRTVKWGRFFRCGAVSGMDAREMGIYEGMHIHSIFDYRASWEAAPRPDVYTAQTAYHLVPGISETGANGMADMDMIAQLKHVHTAEDADRMMDMFLSLYATLPFENDAYRAMLAALDDEGALPMIQHCSAGKDRTGVGCALMLLALGVDEETVMEDYLLSAIFRERVNAQFVGQMAAGLSEHAVDLVAKMMTVTRDMLSRSFAEIKKRYPSYEAFLQDEYGVTPERRARWQALHTI